MKTKTVRKLLQKADKADDIQIDSITGNRIVQLTGSNDFGQVELTAYRGKGSRIETVTYSVDGDGDPSTYDDLFVNCQVKNVKKSLKSFGSEFNGFVVTPQNINAFASVIDSLPGVASGDQSTYVGLYGGEYSVLV